ncbi:hypothetical protein OROMI_030698 [Orobanche minor]
MLKEIASFEPLNLKVLVLRCIMMKGDALELLLPNCPLLRDCTFAAQGEGEAFSVPGMPKLKKLVVYFRTNWNKVSLPVTCFISAWPCLEEFRLEISELYFYRFPKPPRVPVDIFEVPKAPSPHSHLKRFVFSGYRGVRRCGDKDFGHFDVSLELVRFVVDNCVALEEIVIGKCHPVGLVRDIVDYGEESLDHIIMDPVPPPL